MIDFLFFIGLFSYAKFQIRLSNSVVNCETAIVMSFMLLISLFDSAAEAVMKGQSESILLFHQQNVPRTKLEQVRYPQLSGKLNKVSRLL